MLKKALNILAVDDDESILKLLKLYLGSLGHFVETDTSSAKVLERQFRQKIDLLISDIEMPELGGFEFIQEFREKPFMKFVPIVMLTASRDLEKIKNAASLGVVEYLVKPIDKEVGVEKLKRVIERISASEVQLASGSKNAIATVDLKVRLLSVGEDFVKVIANFPVPTGTPLPIHGELFDQLELKMAAPIVEECSPTDEGFLLFLRFSGLSEISKNAIRNWMNRFV